MLVHGKWEMMNRKAASDSKRRETESAGFTA